MQGLVIKYWELIYSLRKPAPMALLTNPPPDLERLKQLFSKIAVFMKTLSAF